MFAVYLTVVSYQMTTVETVAEVKAVGSADSGPTSTITESTVKPPPFKDHTFMVGAYVCMNLSSSCSFVSS